MKERSPGVLAAALFAAALGCDPAPSDLPKAPEQQPEGDHRILLRSGVFTPPANLQDFAAGTDRHGLLQFESVLEDPGAVAAEGIVLYNYLSHLGYMAHIPASVTAGDLAALGVRSYLDLDPYQKVDPHLWKKDESETIRVFVYHATDIDKAAIEAQVASVGGTILATSPFDKWTHVRVPRDELLDLAAPGWVWWIERDRPGPPSATLDEATDEIRATDVLASPWGDLTFGLTGMGVIIGMWETPGGGGPVSTAGPDTTHPDFEFDERITIVEGGNSEPYDHATQVAGILIGDGSASAQRGDPLHRSGSLPIGRHLQRRHREPRHGDHPPPGLHRVRDRERGREDRLERVRL